MPPPPTARRVFAGLCTICCGVLAGCAGLVSPRQANEAWIGRPLEQLVAVWGPPAQSFRAEDGGSIHSWSMVITKHRRSEECRRSLQVDERGLISRWLYDTCPRQQPRRGAGVDPAAGGGPPHV